MQECAGLATCPFYNDRMASKPAMAGMMKRHFCLNDFERCARFMVKQRLGKDAVPHDLFPNQLARANDLLGVH
jgi:hypothetical protein